MDLTIRKYTENDLPEIIRIWNEVVDEGIAFPQEELLNRETGSEFFAAQSFTGVAEEDGSRIGNHLKYYDKVIQTGQGG